MGGVTGTIFSIAILAAYFLPVSCLYGDKILLLALMIDPACIKESQAYSKRRKCPLSLF
jgi:hypothetical protein